MNIISLFAGCGGLDIGFKNAGFNILWANENAASVWDTYEKNHPNTILEKRSISKLTIDEIPNSIGIIGGPPCQSWSVAGNGKGIEDPRGRLFYDFINIIKNKQPLFFVAENVPGMFAKRHKNSLENILKTFDDAGYNVTPELVNANDYGVPQNRKRVFFVGYRKDLEIKFSFPKKNWKKKNTRDAIFDIARSAIPAKEKNKTNGDECIMPNHEYWEGSYSYIFMSRNRVLSWKKPSYTIQASGRQMALHPKAPKMVKVKKDVMKFDYDKKHLYRRLSVRECARIQTFPDDFKLYYDSLDKAYKMIGNAVPVKLAEAIAKKIFQDIYKLNLNTAKTKSEVQNKVNGKILCLPNTVSKRQKVVPI